MPNEETEVFFQSKAFWSALTSPMTCADHVWKIVCGFLTQASPEAGQLE